MTKHTFDWQTEPENSFLKWALLAMYSESRAKGDDQLEKLSDATDRFQNCELSISISGVEMDAKAFMERLEQQMDHAVNDKANELMRSVDRFGELDEIIQSMTNAVREEVFKAAGAAGIELDHEDNWRGWR